MLVPSCKRKVIHFAPRTTLLDCILYFTNGFRREEPFFDSFEYIAIILTILIEILFSGVQLIFFQIFNLGLPRPRLRRLPYIRIRSVGRVRRVLSDSCTSAVLHKPQSSYSFLDTAPRKQDARKIARSTPLPLSLNLQ